MVRAVADLGTVTDGAEKVSSEISESETSFQHSKGTAVHIKAYSLLQEVCINCFKSKYMLVFDKMDG